MLIPVLSFVAAAAALTMWATAPTPRAVADHLRLALALAPPTRLPARTSRGFYATIAYSIVAAAALPLMLWALREWHTTVGVQLFAFVAFAVIVPYVGRVYVARDSMAARDAWRRGSSRPWAARLAYRAMLLRGFVRIVVAATAAVVLAFSLVRGAQGLLEISARTQACFSHDDSGTLSWLIEAQRREIEAERSPEELPWLLLTVLVVPVAEELVYRGLVQHALRRRLKRRVAIGLASLLFGLAHLVVYRHAVHQPVLLGLSFGLAYERAGVLGAILAHMLWNLLMSI